jgi:hypothetical protein
MMAKATPDQRRPLEDKITDQWRALQDTNDVDALRSFVSLFGSAFSVGRQAKLRLAEKLMADNREEGLREAQLLLLQVRDLRTSEPDLAARAVEALARLNLAKGILDHAIHYYKELGRDFGTIIVRDGKTGADIWNDLATDKRFLPYLEGARQSWNGKWKPGIEMTGQQNQVQPVFTLEPAGDLLPLFQRHRIGLQKGQGCLIADGRTYITKRERVLEIFAFPTLEISPKSPNLMRVKADNKTYSQIMSR